MNHVFNAYKDSPKCHYFTLFTHSAYGIDNFRNRKVINLNLVQCLYFLLQQQNYWMSYWYSTEKQREVQMMKQRYLSNILQFNKQQIQEKQRKKYHESKSFTEQSYRMNQQAFSQLLADNDRNTKKREQEKNILKDHYQRQIRERLHREREQKQKDILYARRQRERLDFQQDRRLFQLSKIFNRVTFQAKPFNEHRRTKTEAEESDYKLNPQKMIQQQSQQSTKNLNNIEINIMPPSNRNSGQKTQPVDSLDNFNYSFHHKSTPKNH